MKKRNIPNEIRALSSDIHYQIWESTKPDFLAIQKHLEKLMEIAKELEKNVQ